MDSDECYKIHELAREIVKYLQSSQAGNDSNVVSISLRIRDFIEENFQEG